MKIKFCLLLLVVLALVVGPVLGESPAQQASCSQTTVDIPISSSHNTALAEILTYVVISSEGCPLPHMYCIWEGHGYGAGLSCTPISEDVVNQLIAR